MCCTLVCCGEIARFALPSHKMRYNSAARTLYLSSAREKMRIHTFSLALLAAAAAGQVMSVWLWEKARPNTGQYQ